jgi:hypothetical protein
MKFKEIFARYNQVARESIRNGACCSRSQTVENLWTGDSENNIPYTIRYIIFYPSL